MMAALIAIAAVPVVGFFGLIALFAWVCGVGAAKRGEA